jgi:hypothetical protein
MIDENECTGVGASQEQSGELPACGVDLWPGRKRRVRAGVRAVILRGFVIAAQSLACYLLSLLFDRHGACCI